MAEVCVVGETKVVDGWMEVGRGVERLWRPSHAERELTFTTRDVGEEGRGGRGPGEGPSSDPVTATSAIFSLRAPILRPPAS